MKHDWRFSGDSPQGWPRFRCGLCGLAVRVCKGNPARILAGMGPCSGRPEASQPAFRLHRRVRRYASAMTRWVAAGRPVRTEAEVARIYDQECKPCPHFDRGICRACGCRVRRKGRSVANKIRMGTEHCPLGSW